MMMIIYDILTSRHLRNFGKSEKEKTEQNKTNNNKKLSVS